MLVLSDQQSKNILNLKVIKNIEKQQIIKFDKLETVHLGLLWIIELLSINFPTTRPIH